MADKKKHKGKERVVAERLMHGNLFGAAPGVRDLAEKARDDFESGLDEAGVRQRIRSRLESEGLTMRRMLLPGLSRKLLRVRLRPVLKAVADVIADKSPKRLGAAVDGLLGKIGFDQWLEDYIWTYASTGEVMPMLEGYTGTVYRADFGPPDDRSTAVWLVATPASDVDALVEWFKEEARRAFPAETFAKRGGKALEGAQYYRWNQEGRTYAEIAHENIQDLYPDLYFSDDDEEFQFCEKLVAREEDRIKRLAERTVQRSDIIHDYKSPVEPD